MTTTSIRQLVATSTEIAAKRGFISEEQRQSVHNLSGHSTKTVRQHYLLADSAIKYDDRMQDVSNVRGILGTVGGTQAPLPSTPTHLKIDIQQVSVSIFEANNFYISFLCIPICT